MCSSDLYVKAHIDKGMLEEESISCFLQDEYTVTIDPLLSNAVGGIKLLVHQAQVARAEEILRNAGIPVRFDDRVAIAHNKVMVIDGELVIGGSFNYTKSAEEKNAENVTFTRSACVARLYGDNFERRWNVAAPIG